MKEGEKIWIEGESSTFGVLERHQGTSMAPKFPRRETGRMTVCLEGCTRGMDVIRVCMASTLLSHWLI